MLKRFCKELCNHPNKYFYYLNKRIITRQILPKLKIGVKAEASGRFWAFLSGRCPKKVKCYLFVYFVIIFL